MNAPDPFALGGRQGDADDPILDLVAEWWQKYAQANNAPEDLDNDARDEWVAQMTEVAGDALWDALEASPPVSVEGVIALVDVLLSNAIGIVGELWTDGRDEALCEQILAGLHGLKGLALAGNAAPGRQDAEAMRQRQYALLDEVLALGDAIKAIEPSKNDEPPARCEPEPVTEAEREALRQECEAIAAEYRAPLPEGDAGLVAAVQRLINLRPRAFGHSERGFKVTFETEGEIINPIVDAARGELMDWIEETPAVGLAGVAAKLRYAVEEVDLHEFGAEQMLEVIEREVGRCSP